MKLRSNAGIGLIEVMVALAVLGVILAIAAPSFADLLNRLRVQAVAEQISTDLAFARAESGLRPQGVVVHFRRNAEVSCYSMAYFGTGGRCNCTDAGASCNENATELKTSRIPTNIGVSFQSSSQQWMAANSIGRIGFTSPQMTASLTDFAVTVSGVRGAQLRVELSPMGRVRTCSPNGSVTGVPSCD